MRFLLSLLAMACLTLAAHAESAPDDVVLADFVAYSTAEPVLLGAPAVPLMSADRADVLQVIGQMRSQLTDFATTPPQTGITAAVDAFTQHWDLVIETSAQQRQAEAQSLMGDLIQGNGQAINDFLNAPQIQPEPSLFLDPDFTAAVAPPAGGFFAP